MQDVIGSPGALSNPSKYMSDNGLTKDGMHTKMQQDPDHVDNQPGYQDRHKSSGSSSGGGGVLDNVMGRVFGAKGSSGSSGGGMDSMAGGSDTGGDMGGMA